jgi:CRP/FNR family transcriptional regulator, nitrogen oxide reductase regulator
MNTNLAHVITDPLVEAPLLAGIPEPDRKLIIDTAEYRTIPAKTVIVHGGTKATQLFLLSSGGVKYYKVTKQGTELLLRWLVPGEVFGLGTLLRDPPAYVGSAVATKNCVVYVWPHTKLRELANNFPQLAENALRIVITYLTAYSERHVRLLTKNAEQRLARALLQLGHRAGHVHSTGVQVDITNEQLGSLADVGLFTATRLLTKWERNGAIVKERGKVFIQSPEKLIADSV